MALPHIPAYTLSATAKPATRASFTLDPDRAALLVHDMQRYFVNSFDRSDSDAQINLAIENQARLIAYARAQGLPVYYTAQPPRQSRADRGLLTPMWGPGLQTDADAAIIDDLAPAAADTVLTKWRYSAFVRSPLEKLLRDSGRDQLMITGIYAHIGCLATATHAFMLDIEPFMIADALADFGVEQHQHALGQAASLCAGVLNTSDVLTSVAV